MFRVAKLSNVESLNSEMSSYICVTLCHCHPYDSCSNTPKSKRVYLVYVNPIYIGLLYVLG